MAYDSLVLSAVVKELSETIIGARVEKIYQPAKTDLVVLFHSPAGKNKLLLSADARMPRVHLTNYTRENPLTPPLFCMVLRKHLEGGKVTGISQPDFERILHIHIDNLDELGQRTTKTLICEIMGKHSNIILTDENDMILDGIIRFSHAVNRHREVLPGRPYVSPPAQGKENPLRIDEETYKSLLWDTVTGTENPGKLRIDKWLLNTFTGFSPQTCREIAARAGIASNFPMEALGDYELNRLWLAFGDITDKVKRGQFTPTLVDTGADRLKAFSAFDLTQYDTESREHGTMNSLLDSFYQHQYERQLFKQEKDRLLKVVANEINRNQKKLAIQEETIVLADEAEEFRVKGEILTANLHLLEPYNKKVCLVNFYDPEQRKIEIELDPALTPALNAQAYFKKYNKAKAGRTAALELKKKTDEELRYLDSVSSNIEQAGTLNDLADIKSELLEQGLLKEKRLPKNKRQEPAVNQPLTFESPDGWTISVGKNNKQNDFLTLKKAKADDLWLHVKDIPGSHVIIRCESPDLPDDTLLRAAQLAAYFSKARNSTNVPVDYTRKKHVHKPNGAKPGIVIYENQRTIFVDPPKDLADFKQA